MQIKDCVLIEPYTCNEDQSIVEIAKKLRETTLRHIFVVNKEFYPVGIISVIDINNRVVAESKNPEIVKAKDIMSKPDVININADIHSVLKMMIEKNRSMNPVVKDNRMVGIITLSELLAKTEAR